MITTASSELRDEALIYRDQGKAGFFGGEHVRLGYAWRMSEVHAAVGLVHLARLDEFIATRQTVAHAYDEAFAEHPRLRPLPVPPGCSSNYYKYVAVLAPDIDRAGFKQRAARGARRDAERRGLRPAAAPRAGVHRARRPTAAGGRGPLRPSRVLACALGHERGGVPVRDRRRAGRAGRAGS